VTYTLEEIQDVWLGNGRIAPTDNEMVLEFNRVERMLGRDWMEARLTPAPGVTSHGAMDTHLAHSNCPHTRSANPVPGPSGAGR
jgi:hypothetical protein